MVADPCHKLLLYSVIVKQLFQVKAILVNIFGGIVDCKIVANGIVKAGRELNINVPLVVRLEGEIIKQLSSLKVVFKVKFSKLIFVIMLKFNSFKRLNGGRSWVVLSTLICATLLLVYKLKIA